jgi:nicotinamidase-related amidase
MRHGFEVYPVVDAVAGTSPVAHQWALQRMVQVGAHPLSWISVTCELQRDWNRTATAQGMIKSAAAASARSQRSSRTAQPSRLSRTNHRRGQRAEPAVRA